MPGDDAIMPTGDYTADVETIATEVLGLACLAMSRKFHPTVIQHGFCLGVAEALMITASGGNTLPVPAAHVLNLENTFVHHLRTVYAQSAAGVLGAPGDHKPN